MSLEVAGHPIHPVLTDLPVGFWTSAWVLDIVGGERHAPTADLLVGIGLLSTIPTIATGAADWTALPRRDKRIGALHAAANVTATALYGASYVARRRGDRRRGLVLGHLAAAAATLGGYLGGELVFSRGAGRGASSER
jgi:uncharacterized membrane protein